MIWLASYPRSGNTFLRIVLQEVYGLRTSSFHEESGRPLDPDYADYPAVKTHLLPHQLRPRDPSIPAVYIVRDGRDCVVSMAYQRRDILNQGTDLRSHMREAIVAAWGSFFSGWSKHVRQWTKRASVVIRFEQLIQDPIACAEQLRPFLDLPEPRREQLPTFDDLRTKDFGFGRKRNHLHADGGRTWRRLFFRRGEVGSWRNEMPGDLQRLFIRLHGDVLQEFGYENDVSRV